MCNNVIDWYNSNLSQYVTVGGYAGTGKTSIIPYLVDYLRRGRWGRLAFAAFTGKASFVMKTKLREAGVIDPDDFCGTLHSLMYVPLMKEVKIKGVKKKVISGWRKKEDLDVTAVIVDEASMVNRELWNDLLSYDVPIIAIGDHGQLPPVGGKFNLMQSPQLMLTKVHRQALDSPIIQLSQRVRQTGKLVLGYPKSLHQPVFAMNWRDPRCQNTFKGINFQQDIICLCGFNSTRVELNNMIREKKKWKMKFPYLGERMICLRNNHNSGVMNGQIGTLTFGMPSGHPGLMNATVKMDGIGDDYLTLIYDGCFGQVSYDEVFEMNLRKKYEKAMKDHGCINLDLFDYGYAITVHKSQGSEWDKVILFDQRNKYQNDDDYRRWLYTAVTRAREKLFVIYNYNNW